MSETYSLTERLAQHVLRPVDPAARERARLHLLDWIGCIAGAMRSGGTGRRLANAAALGNLLEMDDVHREALLHPGPVVWPALVTHQGHAMATALDAAVRGYEAMIAVGATFDARHYAFYHNTATAGVFGAAAAAASLLDLGASQLVDALGNAGSVSGGLWRMRHEAVLTKQLHVMHAVQSGGQIALWAADGITGPRFILEGEQGLYAATCAAPRPERLIIGDAWRIFEVSFKPWGACRHAHPAIDAALQLRERIGLTDVPIHVETYADALAFCDRAEPETVLQAKFSLQHAVAVVAARGVPQLADFELDAVAALAEARTRVTVAEAPDITARYPAHFGARVTAGGETVELVDTLGDPERPLDRAGVIAKAQALMRWGGFDWAFAAQAVALVLDSPDDLPFDRIADLVERIVAR